MTNIRITPVGGFDIPGLEQWLSCMAAKGLKFSFTVGPLTVFTPIEPQTLQVHLEIIRGTPEDDPELNDLYRQQGWAYWGIFRNNYYVFVSDDPQAQAHTDPEALDYALKRFLREKLLAGAVLVFANVLLIGLYGRGASRLFDWSYLRWFPLEVFSNGTSLPLLLSLLGLGAVDLAYLAGFYQLVAYRRTVRQGRAPVRRKGGGGLLAVGTLLLLPVLINTAQLFLGMDYRPYDLEGSGFVTLQTIEGQDFHVSQREFYHMDYISHGGTLLQPEYWYFQQYGAWGSNQDSSDVPRLELRITRYPLSALASSRMEEWSRQSLNSSGEYEALPLAYGLDEILFAPREGRVHENERIFLPGGMLLLRQGSTVLVADYYGEKDLPKWLEAFAAMMNDV